MLNPEINYDDNGRDGRHRWIDSYEWQAEWHDGTGDSIRLWGLSDDIELEPEIWRFERA